MDNDIINNIDTLIAKEYERYLVVNKISTFDNSPQYMKWLEELLLLMCLRNNNKSDPVFYFDDYINNHFVILYSFKNKRDSKYIKKYIIKNIQDFLLKQEYNIPIYSINESSNNLYCEFICGILKKYISTTRMNILKKSFNNTYKKYIQHFHKLLLICILRYESILSLYFQCSLPLETTKILYNNFNAHIDALSSPFKCQLNRLSEKIKYYSLFYDIDKFFGSMGNIFNNNIDDVLYDVNTNYTSIIFDVPNHTTLIHKTFKYIYKQLVTTNKNVHFIVTTPNYDLKYLPLLVSNKYYTYYKLFDNLSYYYENIVHSYEPIEIVNKYILHFYLFSKNKNNTLPLYKIPKIFNSKFISNINSDKYKKKYEFKLKKEYNRYIIINKLKYIKSGREWINILERFLNSMGNVIINGRQDKVFVELDDTHDVYITLKNELVEKKINDIPYIITTIRNYIKEFFTYNFTNNILYYKTDNNTFVCENYTKTINETRVFAFMRKLSLIHKSQYATILILILLLRYECILAGGNNWNLPYKLYNYLNNYYNVKVECFGSPLNSQLLLLDTNGLYCSLFYDTDKYFGSLGNLFLVDPITLSKKFNGVLSVTLFPPNIPSLIYKMIDTINGWFEHFEQLRVFTGLLEWTNFEPMDLLANHKYLKYIKKYSIGEYYFENSLVESVDKIIIPGFNSYILYVLANYDKSENEPSYTTIDNMIRTY